MKKYFGDASITLRFMQQFLNENFNDRIIINDEYYTHIDMNYGFAHYIAKYLDVMFPCLDPNTKKCYDDPETYITSSSLRSLTEPISIANYFLCSNTGSTLTYDPFINREKEPGKEEKINGVYDKIYNKYMQVRLIEFTNENNNTSTQCLVEADGKYIIDNDLPLFVELNPDWDGQHISDKYKVLPRIVYNLQQWQNPKRVCEIDDLVASYLLGRAIGPNSSMEEIYYAQQLLIRSRNIEQKEKGIWCPKGMEGTIYDMTTTVINYQRSIVSNTMVPNVFVTGYFDIFTEAYALKEVGAKSHGIFGL